MVIKPQGPLVGADADQLRGHLAKAMEESLGRVVLDVSTVAFVDSRGLEVLVDATEQLTQDGGVLKLAEPDMLLREILDLTDLSSMFEYFDDADEAVRSLQ